MTGDTGTTCRAREHARPQAPVNFANADLPLNSSIAVEIEIDVDGDAGVAPERPVRPPSSGSDPVPKPHLGPTVPLEQAPKIHEIPIFATAAFAEGLLVPIPEGSLVTFRRPSEKAQRQAQDGGPREPIPHERHGTMVTMVPSGSTSRLPATSLAAERSV